MEAENTPLEKPPSFGSHVSFRGSIPPNRHAKEFQLLTPSHGRPFLSAEPGGVAREGAGPGMVGMMPSELHRKLST